MKKLIDLYLTLETGEGFAESSLAFIQPSLEGLGATVLSMRAHTETHFVDLDATHPVPWPVPPVEEEPKTEAPAIPEIEEPTPAVVEAQEEIGTPVIDQAALKKKLFAYRDKFGTDALVALYESHGNGAKTFKEIHEDCYASMFDAAEEKINAAD